jgi:four helix bundle protein
LEQCVVAAPEPEWRMFSHLKLQVYGKALASVTGLTERSLLWDKRHAVVEQLLRASESVVLNLAEGARLRIPATKQHALDYSIGSALECAGCLDIAVIKHFLLPDEAAREKRSLGEVVRMLVALRRSWGNGQLREEPAQYRSPESGQPCLFAHERLDAYQVGLECMRWFHALPAGAELSSRVFRQVDKAATSVILNIAESNGRYPEADRRKFLDIAESSAVKAAAYLDLCQSKAELDAEQKERGIELLGRVALMLWGLASS